MKRSSKSVFRVMNNKYAYSDGAILGFLDEDSVLKN